MKKDDLIATEILEMTVDQFAQVVKATEEATEAAKAAKIQARATKTAATLTAVAAIAAALFSAHATWRVGHLQSAATLEVAKHSRALTRELEKNRILAEGLNTAAKSILSDLQEKEVELAELEIEEWGLVKATARVFKSRAHHAKDALPSADNEAEHVIAELEESLDQLLAGFPNEDRLQSYKAQAAKVVRVLSQKFKEAFECTATS